MATNVNLIWMCRPQIHSTSRQLVELNSHFRRGTSHRRSSYAISQEAGPGRIITSGTSIHHSVQTVDEKVTTCNNSHILMHHTLKNQVEFQIDAK